MANPSQSFRIPTANNIKISNINVTSINTEITHIIEDRTNQLLIKHRNSGNIKISFVVGESGLVYFTIPKGTMLTLDNIDFSGKNIFIQSDKLGIIEILEAYF